MMNYDYINKYYNYIVQEDYDGKVIDVYVSECWDSNGSIFSAVVSCPKYNIISDFLGHKSTSYVNIESLGINTIVDKLTVDDVHDVIFKEIEIAEKNISNKMKIKHDNFGERRYFRIIKEYNNQNIVVGFSLDVHSSNVWITCPSSAQIKVLSMNDNCFRNEIISEVERCKKLIDNGYVFSKTSILGRIKSKTKKLF